MNRSVDILNELNEISPLVAGIGRQNVFTVPYGYFDCIADTVMMSLKEGDNTVIETGEVPAGYFDSLPGNILAKIKNSAANELYELSPFLAGIKKVNPFKVPESYFDELSSEVFSKLDDDVLPRILQDAAHLQPFKVPDGYFENLSTNILNKIQQAQKAKVIAMPKRFSVVLQYAAAAIFTGAVILGVYKFSNTSPLVIADGARTASTTIDLSIERGIAIAADDKKFDETLGNLDEEVITQYLEKNGSEADMALLTSDLDENDLPNQEDYLTDEKTLENFIEAISSKN